MVGKSSKSKRKEDRIQNLERDISNLKKKNKELQQQKTVRLNDEQLQCFLDELTHLTEWSTDRIIDETPGTTIVRASENQRCDGFSFIIKWIIASLFFVVSITVVYSLYSIWGEFWSKDWANRIALFIVSSISVICFVLGIEIVKEKDRNYIISLFSALVALVALIVTLIK